MNSLIALVILTLGDVSFAQATFSHAFGQYQKNEDTSPFFLQAVFQSRNDTKASATIACRKDNLNTVAIETFGRWVNLSNEQFNYQGSYWCAPITTNQRRLVLKTEFINNVICVWKGEALSNLFAEAKCREIFGTGTVGKTFGGCVDGPYNNNYLFEAICD
jgi:hypothetical protein